jgi:hypothetical protein
LALGVKGHSHVENYVGVTERMKDFDFSDEFSEGFSIDVFLSEAFDGYWGAKPLALEDFSIAPGAYKVDRGVKLQLVEVNDVSNETRGDERGHEVCLSLLSDLRAKVLGVKTLSLID